MNSLFQELRTLREGSTIRSRRGVQTKGLRNLSFDLRGVTRVRGLQQNLSHVKCDIKNAKWLKRPHYCTKRCFRTYLFYFRGVQFLSLELGGAAKLVTRIRGSPAKFVTQKSHSVTPITLLLNPS